MQDNAQLHSVEDVASRLSVSVRKVWSLIKDAEIKTVRVGARVLIAEVDLSAYIERLRARRSE